MAVITEDQLDTEPAVKPARVVTQLDPVNNETPEQIARRKYPELFKEEAPNVARERQTVSGEILGGLSQFGGDLKTAFAGDASQPDMGPVERLLHGLRAPLGLLRAASGATVIGPKLTNAATALGESASDALQKKGFTRGADVVGGLTTALGDVASGVGQAKLGTATSSALQKVLPTKQSKIASLASRAEGDIANVAKAGEADIATETLLRDAQIKDIRQVANRNTKAISEIDKAAELEKQAVKRNASADTYLAQSDAEAAANAIPDPVKLQERLAKNATPGEVAGRSFKDSYQRELSRTKASFNKEYEDILRDTDKVEGAALNYQQSLEKLAKEKGISRPLPTKAEGAGAKAQAALTDVDEVTAETVGELTQQLKGARDPAQRKVLQDALDETMAQGTLGEKPTLTDMLRERQRLKAGERAAFQAKDDNLFRQWKDLRSGLDEDIRSVAPDKLDALEAAGSRYVQEYVPFFSKKSVTRAIAEGSPETVLDQIIKPTVSAQGRVLKNKAVESAERGMALLDDAGKEQVSSTFIKRGFESNFKEGSFDKQGLVKWWDSYADPSNTGNKVLKTALGEKYKDMEQAVEAFRSNKPKQLADVAAQVAKASEKQVTSQTAGIEKLASNKKATLQDFLEEAPKLNQQGLQNANKEIEGIRKATAAKQEAIRAKLKADIEEITGKPYDGAHGGAFTGSLFITEGVLEGATGNVGRALWKISAGGLLLISRAATAKLLNAKRGVSVFRTLATKAPGTAPAAAAARIAGNILSQTDDE
jgi:hypothetical protein